MIHYTLRNTAQQQGGFTDLFVLAYNAAYNATTRTWGTDFTAAAVTQSYDLLTLTDANGLILYAVTYPLAMIYVKTPFTNDANNPKLDVGVTGTATNFIAGTAGDLEVTGKVMLPAAAAQPYAVVTASQKLTCLITSAAANVSALAGNAEIWIYACLAPTTEWGRYRQA